MLSEFFAAVRSHLRDAGDQQLQALRACRTLEDLRRAQGYLDGLDAARSIFDALVKEIQEDDD